MNIKLYQLSKEIRIFLVSFIVLLTFGVSVGLTFLYYTTNYNAEGAITRFNGSQQSEDDFEIAENYPKPVSEMLITTHNHLIAFALIFVSLGSIFYFNSIITGFWKTFFMVEPLISTLVTFSSIWGIRYLDNHFVYLTIISSTLIYLSFFVMVVVCLYELLIKSRKNV